MLEKPSFTRLFNRNNIRRIFGLRYIIIMIPIIYCGACKKPREAVIFFKILGDPYAWCKDCYDHWLHHTDPETYARRVMRVQCMTKEEYLVAEVMYQ